MSKVPPPALSTAVLQALPQPVIVCTEDRTIVFVNYAAEAFFGASQSVLSRQRLDDLINEVASQVRSLARQRKRAERHSEIMTRRFTVELSSSAREGGGGWCS